MHLVLVRFLYYGSVAVLFGATLFPLYINADRTTARQLAMPRSASVVLAASSFTAVILWLLIFAVSLGGTDDLSGTVYQLLFSSRLGPSWLARLGLVTLLLWSAVAGRPKWIVCTALVTLFAEGGSGHGAGAGFIGPSLHAVHAVSAGVWLGGLVALARVMAAARAKKIERRVIQDVLKQFSRLGIPSVLLLAVTGSLMTWLILGSFPQPSNDYGRILLLKISLFFLMVVLALINRFLLVPRLRSSKSERSRARLSAAILTERIAGAGILFAVAVLGVTNPHG